MTHEEWKSLLSQLETKGRDVVPITSEALQDFEDEFQVTLPSSYREFCKVFGAGQLANQIGLAVPGYAGKAGTVYSLQELTKSQVALAGQYAELGADGQQLKRGIFFAFDNYGSNHFFDRLEVSDHGQNEFAIYTLFDDCRVTRMCDNFSQFVTECCLGNRFVELIDNDKSAEQVFKPV